MVEDCPMDPIEQPVDEVCVGSIIYTLVATDNCGVREAGTTNTFEPSVTFPEQWDFPGDGPELTAFELGTAQRDLTTVEDAEVDPRTDSCEVFVSFVDKMVRTGITLRSIHLGHCASLFFILYVGL